MPASETVNDSYTFADIGRDLEGSLEGEIDQLFSQLRDQRLGHSWSSFFASDRYTPERDWLEDHQAEIRAMVKDYEQRYDGDIDEVRIENLGGDTYRTQWGLIQTKKKGQAFIKGADIFGREQWTPNVIGLDKDTLLEEGLEQSRKYFEEEAAHVIGQKKYAKELDLSLYELNVLQPLIEGQIDHFYNSQEDDKEQSYILVPGDDGQQVSPERRLYDAYLSGELDLGRYVQSIDPELMWHVDLDKMAQFLDATQQELEDKVEQGSLPAYNHEIDPNDYSYDELAEVDLYLDGKKVEYTEAAATEDQLEEEVVSNWGGVREEPITIEIE